MQLAQSIYCSSAVYILILGAVQCMHCTLCYTPNIPILQQSSSSTLQTLQIIWHVMRLPFSGSPHNLKSNRCLHQTTLLPCRRRTTPHRYRTTHITRDYAKPKFHPPVMISIIIWFVSYITILHIDFRFSLFVSSTQHYASCTAALGFHTTFNLCTTNVSLLALYTR